MAKSAKLFTHLINEPHVKGTFEKVRTETLKGFNRPDLYYGLTRSYTPRDASEPLPSEEKEVVTTVPEKLEYTWKSIIALFDHEYTIDVGNKSAKANLVVNGVVIATDVPATTLLFLEKKLATVREMYDAIPTLDLSKVWDKDANYADRYMTKPKDTYRTAKKTVPVILAPATEKFQAQVKEVVADLTIGTFTEQNFSGAVHPGTKAKWLERIDKLISAVKVARMEANTEETTEHKIGDLLREFIHSKEA